MSGLPKAKRMWMYIAATLVAAFLGYLMALQAAAYLAAPKSDVVVHGKLDLQRDYTRHVLKSMNSLRVGDTLPDYRFENTEHNPLVLSDVVAENTLLIFFDPSCDGCDHELSALEEVIAGTLESQRFLAICSGDSGLVTEKVAQFDIGGRLLYDPSGDYFAQTGVFSYPFNIMINRDRVIQDMIAGSLDRTDLAQFLNEGRLH